MQVRSSMWKLRKEMRATNANTGNHPRFEPIYIVHKRGDLYEYGYSTLGGALEHIERD